MEEEKNDDIEIPQELKPRENLLSCGDKNFDFVKDSPYYKNQDVPFDFLADTFNKAGE